MLLVIALVTAMASPGSALNLTFDVSAHTPHGSCGANMTAVNCTAGADGPSSSGTTCVVSNGQVTCTSSSKWSNP